MCGIYGSIERADRATSIVFRGLKDVEYRGYDSWGLAYIHEDRKFVVIKEIGFLPQNIDLPEARIALGHTRWATNGPVTKENAHPHLDCHKSIALVHNGVVENAIELTNELFNHQFQSQTDSEVIAHLVEEEQQKMQRPFSNAVKIVFEKLEGFNALLISNGKELVAIQKGSSLVAGETDTGFIISSDANSLLPYTNKLHFLKNNELVVMDQGSCNIPFSEVEWKYQLSNLENYPHYMIKEISEEPDALDRLLKDPLQIKKAAEILKDSKNIFLLGCGSAYYAALAGNYLLSEYGDTLSYCYAASEFENKKHFANQRDTILSVSQSGETIDLLEQIRSTQKREARQLAILNSFGSTLYREVPNKVLLYAGVEKAVVATKSFTNMLAAFILISKELRGEYTQGEKIIHDSINAIQKILSRQHEIQEIAKVIAGKKHLFVLGRNLSYPLALENALKIKEASYLHAEGFSGGELKHGVLALIEKGVSVLALTNDINEQNTITNISEAKARGGEIIGVGIKNYPLFDIYFPIENTGADNIIQKAIFGQLLSYYIALEKGLNPDKPRNLAKSVTVK